MNTMKPFVLFLVLVGIGGCAPAVVKNYPGPERPIEQVAILHQTPEGGLSIFEIDDKYVLSRIATYNPDGWDQVLLEPGRHAVSGGVYLPKKYAIFRESFLFEAGKSYHVLFETIDDATRVRVRLQEDSK